MTKKITWNIGTAGFMISQKQWFELNTLNCIEINSTFYRLPTEKSITNWNKFPDKYNPYYRYHASQNHGCSCPN